MKFSHKQKKFSYEIVIEFGKMLIFWMYFYVFCFLFKVFKTFYIISKNTKSFLLRKKYLSEEFFEKKSWIFEKISVKGKKKNIYKLGITFLKKFIKTLKPK